MADNVAITAGSGTTIATDDIGSGVQVQRVKPVWGADGTGTDTQVAQPLPVQATIESSQASNLGTIVTPKYAVISTSSSGDTTLVAAVALKKIRVVSYHFICSGTVGVKFQSGTGGGALTGVMEFTAQTGIAPGFNPLGHFESAAGVLLAINLSAAVAVRGVLTYLEIA
jgi:hypothetical protein